MNIDIPTIHGQWVEEENYSPADYQYHINIIQPDGTEITRAVDRATYERALEMQLQERLNKLEMEG